jgi:D-alanyl-D-alanine carboxypeptidase
MLIFNAKLKFMHRLAVASRNIMILVACIVFSVIPLFSQTSSLQKLQLLVDSLRVAGNYPGLSVAIVSDKDRIALTSGFNDVEKKTPLKSTDMLLQGSVGKTYAAAIGMRLLHKGAFNLNDKVSKYLGDYAWYARVPNTADITIRMLMNHTSGVMRYEFKPAFMQHLTANPDKVWTPQELISYVLDEKPAFEAGKGWEYSDTNYILLAMIIEKVTGKKYYELLTNDILKPFKLSHTLPSTSRKLEGLAQGYAGEANEFGGKNKVIGDDGLFIINPQFEWTGGGVYSTTLDLAIWGKLLYEGKVFDKSLLPVMLDGVPAKLGPDSKYGLGVILRPSPFGSTYGHSGFFPGYLTELVYFPELRVCIAVQCNTSDVKNIQFRPLKGVVEIARVVKEYGVGEK